MGFPVSSYLLIKLASRCNLACSYCYWFRDSTVYQSPPLMSADVEDALVEKLGLHVRKHRLPDFNCIFHGGEPMLFGLKRFRNLVAKLEAMGAEVESRIDFSITTNGVLVTPEWADFFYRHDVRVAVSIDGPQAIHDKSRPTLRGAGSFLDAVRGYKLLKEAGVEPSIIAVCDPGSNPLELLQFFVEDLDCRQFDVLPPDLNHDDNVKPIADYYIKLFDAWYENYFDQGVRVRFLMSLIRSVLGAEANSDSFGYGPLHTISLGTNGTLEPNDVLRIAGSKRTATKTDIRSSSLDDVINEAAWQEAYNSALSLCSQCETCKYRNECGGGHLAHRWSRERSYDNPTVYCNDMIRMFDHVKARVAADVSMEFPESNGMFERNLNVTI